MYLSTNLVKSVPTKVCIHWYFLRTSARHAMFFYKMLFPATCFYCVRYFAIWVSILYNTIHVGPTVLYQINLFDYTRPTCCIRIVTVITANIIYLKSSFLYSEISRRWIAQSTLHVSPMQTCPFRNQLILEAFNHDYIIARIPFAHTFTPLFCSHIFLYAAEWCITERTKLSKFRNGSKVDSNPGSRVRLRARRSIANLPHIVCVPMTTMFIHFVHVVTQVGYAGR